MYEKHGIMVNFTVRGHVVHPECKNHYCKQKMLNGLRVFCDTCRHQIDDLPTICLDLPQMDASQFDDLVRHSPWDHAPLTEDAEFFYDILEAISGTPSRGLHLYREDALSESKLTTIVPHPRTRELADTIEDCIEDAIRAHRFDDRSGLRAKARKAVFNFIESLKIPELTQAIGKFDDFPWKDVVPAPEEAFHGEQSAFSIDDITHGLNQLLSKSILVFCSFSTNPSSVDDHNSLQFTSHSWDDSVDSSDDVNYYFEGEPGWGDTDDEVEEANAADDAIKIIEGDW